MCNYHKCNLYRISSKFQAVLADVVSTVNAITTFVRPFVSTVLRQITMVAKRVNALNPVKGMFAQQVHIVKLHGIPSVLRARHYVAVSRFAIRILPTRIRAPPEHH